MPYNADSSTVPVLCSLKYCTLIYVICEIKKKVHQEHFDDETTHEQQSTPDIFCLFSGDFISLIILWRKVGQLIKY